MEENKGKLENFINKKNITAKKLIKATTLIMGLALIVLMSISNVIIDPYNIDLYSWATNSLILVGIMVFGLLMGESIGSDKQSEKVNGLYQRNLKDYNTMRAEISPIEIYFSQFYLWFKEKELYKKKINYLVDNSFDMQWAKVIIGNIEKTDMVIGKMILDENDKETIYLKGDKKIKKVNEEQAKVVISAITLKLDTPNYPYFLTAFGDGKGGGVLERGSYLQKKLRSDKRWNRVLKIVSSLFISLLWGMATIKDFADGEQMQAWFNLISRLTAFLTSFVSGWSSSVVSVKTMAEIIENKRNVLFDFKTFYNNKEFKPESYEEQVEREFMEQEKARKIKLLEYKDK